MWEVLAVESVRVEEGADEDGIHIPFDIGRRPIDGVGVPLGLGIVACHPGCAVIGCGVSFAEVVSFYYG